MKNNRILLSLVILIVVIFACLGLLAAASGGYYLLGGDRLGSLLNTATPPTSPATPTPSATEPPLSTTIPTPHATPTSDLEAAAELPPEIASQMDEIQQQVVRIRSLESDVPVKRSLLTVDQLRQKVEEEFLADYSEEEVTDDVRVLAAFGLLEAEYDLYDLYLELYTEQIAGYYDIEKDEMYVVLEEGFSGPQRSTYAHEYTHALQNQTFNVREGLNYNEEYCETDSEYCAALQALMEGDATLTEQSWLYLYATDRDRREIEEYYQSTSLPVFDTAPAFLQEDFLFPYIQGVDFVLALFEDGSFAHIDQAYIDPPVSTEQILHPELYPTDRPVPLELPDLAAVLGRELRELDRGVMGEWYTYLILARGVTESIRLADGPAAEAAAGWGGDGYVVYWDEQAGEPLVLLSTIWDTPDDAAEFASAFEDYGLLRWGRPQTTTTGDLIWDAGDQGAVLFSHSGDFTTWVIAPTQADVRSILQALSVENLLGAR